jgi:hemolysin activation/secretion protein/CHASE2 domain-containing sensor protein
MHDFQDAFISYGRADSKQFAIALYQRLLEQGIKVWFDQNDIPLAVDFQNQINDGIEKSDNFLYIISPHSVNSPYCLKEIELAVTCNKRIVPLLHVEQIDRQIWQTRNPQGQDADWESYQRQGLHSSFANMHDKIAKLNWIYFREAIENFDNAFADLVRLFDHRRDYVKKHTYFLNRALDWERQQQQSSHLLTGEECQTAETWLKQRFQGEQSPCLPTDLHSEFITESIKNANNLTTEVFLCHAMEDGTIAAQIRRSLMREALTVWTNRTDIRTGMAFQSAIEHGIEEADNLVYLLSPHAVRSADCQHELEYALSLNKRIIPIRIAATPLADIPSVLRNVQYIDLTDNTIEADYQQDESKLIRTLREDATYFAQHKTLLAKAMKWERQTRNPGLLLRGYNLRHAEAWLTAAQSHPHYPPTITQTNFIQTSQQSAQTATLDVFIAYSRVDSDFARRLNDALQMQGKATWFDQENIASGTDFQQEIFRGIEAANHFLLIISPNSMRSPYCIDEIEYARKFNKRIIPVLYQPVAVQDLSPGLAAIQWIDFHRHNGDFLSNFGELIRTIDTDQDHTKFHTRLLLRSMQWEAEGRDPSFLLRGKELKDAEQWLKVATTKQPAIHPSQQKYITISRCAPLRSPHPVTVGLASLGAGLFMIAVRLLGWLEPLELAAYDQFMRWKPSEAKDQRLLLVEIDDADIKLQNKRYPKGVRGGSLPDPALAELLDRLQQHKPKVIGLDLYRDFATDQPKLAQHFQQSANFVVLCKLQSEAASSAPLQPGTTEGVPPPPELPEAQFQQRLGFSDLAFDEGGDSGEGSYVRRHVLIDTPTPPACSTDSAFSLTIARQYLATLGQPYIAPFAADGTFLQNLQFGDKTIRWLTPYSGAYFRTPIGEGYQTLVNFRKYRGHPHRFIDRVKLRDVLADRIPTEKIRDRMVLIGVTARASVNDYAMTPVGELPGVIIQAQLVSQLTSAVLDTRPMIWWWPFWGDGLWILGWAVVGGGIVWAIHRPRTLLMMWTAAVIVLSLICYGVFVLTGGWLALVPAAIAVVAAGNGTLLLNLGILPAIKRTQKTKRQLVHGYGVSLVIFNTTIAPPVTAQVPLPRQPQPPATAPPTELPLPQPLPPPIELLPPASIPADNPAIAPPTTLTVKRFEVIGSTVFSQQDFAKMTQGYIDRPISLSQLFELRTQITNRYLERGYITSGAYIPAQKLENGVVKIQILEGRLAGINVTGTRQLRPNYIRSRIGIATQTPLNQNRLLEALQLLQLNPLIKNISAELSAGNRVGENLLEVQVVEAADFSTQTLLDNARSPSAGSDRRKLQLTDANFFGFGDRFSVGYSNTNGSNAVDLTYSLPINPRNGSLNFSYGSSSSRVIEAPFDVLDIRSKSQFYELSLRQPLIQTPIQEFAIGITANHQRNQATLLDGALPFPAIGADAQGQTKITALRTFQEYTQRSRQSAFALRSQFSVGINALNATINEQAPDSRFFVWRGQAQYIQLLAPETLVLFRTTVQLADRPLVPVEQFSLGGQDTVRGYRQDLLSSDNALFASIEARLPVLRLAKINTLVQINPFVDFGMGGNRNASNGSNTLTSVGLGLRLQIGDRLTGRLDWGVPLRFLSGSPRSSQENQLYFSMVYDTPL